MGAYPRRDARAIDGDLERCYEYFPRLDEREAQHAGNLSGGEQQMLAIGPRADARAAAAAARRAVARAWRPTSPRELFAILARIARDEGATMLLVEQNANLALALADYAYVLEAGRIALSGEAAEIRPRTTASSRLPGGVRWNGSIQTLVDGWPPARCTGRWRSRWC